MLEAIWLYHENMQNLENMDVFEILITQKLLKCSKDPFVRSALICNSFSDKFSDCLNTINHLNLKLFIFVGILQVLKFEFLFKFRILKILNFHPC